MKKILSITTLALFAAVAIAGLVTIGCTGSAPKDATPASTDSSAQKSEKVAQYTCSMHPEVVQNKPGDCPKCGMKLVEKK